MFGHAGTPGTRELTYSECRLNKDFGVRFNVPAKLANIELRGDCRMTENEGEKDQKHGLKDSITGFGQKIIGEIESLAGVVNADPLAQAEGEFNVEVGTVREELAEKGIEEEKSNDVG